MRNYIFVNAPQSKSDTERLIKRLVNAAASSLARQLKDESSSGSSSITTGTFTNERISSNC
ncbi:MAG: hypothetical protein K6A79_04960 [Ruminococcus sp.]|nr:hypothetical protein [Ruminococcus sp.]